ncbi:MAG: Fic family protein [Defluviitaleaceae bacterium]|nr:Fic family protein [Defluviitaleaceae bacterium]
MINLANYENIIQMWKSYGIKTVIDLDIRLNNFRVQFAYNTTKIENPEVTYHATREVFEDKSVKIFTGSPETLAEISNQRKCYGFLLPKIMAKEPITLALIKEAHEITTMGTYDDRRFFELGERPGKFKRNDFVVGRNEVGSLPEEVEADLTKLVDEIADALRLNEPTKILMAATYFHARFVYIHPFSDGNGRIGRTMSNYFLMVNNHPPLIVFDEYRDEYYRALEHYDESEDIEPLYDFFQQQLIKTWDKTFERYKKRIH